MKSIKTLFKSAFNKDYDPEADENDENVSSSMFNKSQAYIKKQAFGAITNTTNLESLKSYIDAILEYYNILYTRDNEYEIDQTLTTELKQFENIASNNLIDLQSYVNNHKLNKTSAYECANKAFDTFLEKRGISRDMEGNVLINMLGGLYKKSKIRRRPLQKKSRRVKKRMTKTMRKSRKSKK